MEDVWCVSSSNVCYKWGGFSSSQRVDSQAHTNNSQTHIEPWISYQMVQYYIETCGIPNVNGP